MRSRGTRTRSTSNPAGPAPTRTANAPSSAVSNTRSWTRPSASSPKASTEAWLEDNAPSDSEEALVALGEQEWTACCAKCHGLDGSGDIGPSIQGNGTLLNRSGLKRLLLNGQNEPTIESYMPPVGAGWEERQFDALIAYVKSNQRLSTAAGQGGQSGG